MTKSPLLALTAILALAVVFVVAGKTIKHHAEERGD